MRYSSFTYTVVPVHFDTTRTDTRKTYRFVCVQFSTNRLEIHTIKIQCFCVCCRDRINSGAGGGESKADGEQLLLYSPLKVVFFVALMCGMLVLMYFFYNVFGEWDNRTALVYSGGVITSAVLLM